MARPAGSGTRPINSISEEKGKGDRGGPGAGDYLVEIGGEIRLRGRKYPGALPQKIGIDAPETDPFLSEAPFRIISPGSGAITTSGNYRKYRKSGGRVVSHLIDPHSGYPFSNELLSVTVWAKDAITADGYDNALMGMGLRKALAFAGRHPELEVYFIYRDMTKGGSGVIRDTASRGFYKTHESR